MRGVVVRIVLRVVQALALAAVVAGVDLYAGLAWALIVGGSVVAAVCEAQS